MVLVYRRSQGLIWFGIGMLVPALDRLRFRIGLEQRPQRNLGIKRNRDRLVRAGAARGWSVRRTGGSPVRRSATPATPAHRQEDAVLRGAVP